MAKRPRELSSLEKQYAALQHAYKLLSRVEGHVKDRQDRGDLTEAGMSISYCLSQLRDEMRRQHDHEPPGQPPLVEAWTTNPPKSDELPFAG